MTSDLTFTCPETEVKDRPANLWVNFGPKVEPPAFVGFLDRDYRYKLVTI